MPIATYISPSGEQRELFFHTGLPTVATVDGTEWQRAVADVPAMVGVKRPAPTQRDEVLAGYREAELQGKRSNYSANQIKKVWNY